MTAAAVRRRRELAQRVPLLECGCADPWPCEADAGGWPDDYATARRHLAVLGYMVDTPRPRVCGREAVS